MTDITKLMHLKYAVQSMRQRYLDELNAIEAIIDDALPREIPDPGPPGSRKDRIEWYRKNGIRAKYHGRSVTRQRSKATKKDS